MFESMKKSVELAEKNTQSHIADIEEFRSKINHLDRAFGSQMDKVIQTLRSSGIDYHNQSFLEITRLRPFYKHHYLEPEIFCQTKKDDIFQSEMIRNFEKMKGYVSHEGSIDFSDHSFSSYDFDRVPYFGKEIYYLNISTEKFLLPIVIRYRNLQKITSRSKIILDVNGPNDILLRSVLAITDHGNTESHFEFGIGDRSPIKQVEVKRFLRKNRVSFEGGYD